RLSGRVRFPVAPAGPLWAEFAPVDGTIGNLRSARLSPDGSFEVEDLPIGRLAIRLVGAPFRRSGDPALDRYLARVQQMYLIRRTVPWEGLEIALQPGQGRFDRSVAR